MCLLLQWALREEKIFVAGTYTEENVIFEGFLSSPATMNTDNIKPQVRKITRGMDLTAHLRHTVA